MLCCIDLPGPKSLADVHFEDARKDLNPIAQKRFPKTWVQGKVEHEGVIFYILISCFKPQNGRELLSCRWPEEAASSSALAS
jgi:hypothetical protein